VPEQGIWAPLRRPTFRALWIAAVVSNVGTWMHDTAAAWTMTGLSPSPIMVSLMQTATSLPFFLLALPAGALADVVDRRRMLLVTQAWMLAAATALAALAFAGAITPPGLLGLSFALGIGAAMNAPAWQAITPELVPRAELPAAVALGGISINVARAVGPALGGALVAAGGPGAVFLLNACSFLGVLLAIALWRRERPAATLPPERVFGAVRAGARYVRHATALHAVLVRSAVFVLPASAVWALLPLVARRSLGLDATGYGIVLGGLGAGAITGALVLPPLRSRVPLERLLGAATLLFAATSGGLALVPSLPPALGLTFAGGFAWMVMMSSVSIAAQEGVPAWVRARALAVCLLVIQGSLAAGALVWGVVATHTSLATALLAAAGTLVLGILVALRVRLHPSDGLDLTASHHWDEPVVIGSLAHDDGPVLVTVDYRLDPERADEFVSIMSELERTRRRDGAIEWSLYQDVADPRRWLETFVVESWVEHLRQHERVTVSDRAIQERVYAIIDGGEPHVSHLVARRSRD
jgi:MFS family permease